MIFVDTSAWFSAFVPWATDHAVAAAWLQMNREPLVTTDYVVDETLTLLKARRERHRAIELARDFWIGTLAILHHVTEEEIQQAASTFRRFVDKDWSFTDCTSKVVMESLGITTAFSFDHHFRQFGTVSVVP